MKIFKIEVVKGALKGKTFNAAYVDGFYTCYTSHGLIDFPSDYVRILG